MTFIIIGRPGRYIENSINVSRITTSSLEGENARINGISDRNLALDKLDRILFIYSLYVNIRQGIKAGRITPEVQNMDLVQLVKMSVLTRDSISPTNAMEWAYRTFCTGPNFVEPVLVHGRLDPIAMINIVLGHRTTTEPSVSVLSHGQTNIEQYLTPRVTSSNSNCIGFASMTSGLSDPYFNENEAILLSHIVKEQYSLSVEWRENVLITALCYDRHRLENLNCREKSIDHILKFLKSDSPVLCSSQSFDFFSINDNASPNDIEFTETESQIASSLQQVICETHNILQNNQLLCYNVKMFVQLWDYISTYHGNVAPRTQAMLQRKWKNMLEAQNYFKRQSRKRPKTRSTSLNEHDHRANTSPNIIVPAEKEVIHEVIPIATIEQNFLLLSLDEQFGVGAKGKWVSICASFVQSYPKFSNINPNRLKTILQDRLRRYRLSIASQNEQFTRAPQNETSCSSLENSVPLDMSTASIAPPFSSQGPNKACHYCTSVKRGASLCLTGTARKCANNVLNKPDRTQTKLNFISSHN